VADKPLRIGTRGSDLALWQAHHVQSRLSTPTEIIIIKTQGDRIQHLTLDKVEGKGFFTKEIEQALLEERVDLAVHSFKDLPTEDTPGLGIVAVPQRAAVRDVIVCKNKTTDALGLPKGARVGTSSLRRKAHILSIRADLEMVDIRGNVPTRLGKVVNSELDAVVLAEAGMSRLGLIDEYSQKGIDFVPIAAEQVCPAPAQGALALQARTQDETTAAATQSLHDDSTAQSVGIERALLSRFGGGCHLPLGAYCTRANDEWTLRALVASPDGKKRMESVIADSDPQQLVERVHADLIAQGAQEYL